jgi:heme exporter protein B
MTTNTSNIIWNQLVALVKKDLKLEFRRREILSTTLIFSLTMIVLFSLLFQSHSAEENTWMYAGILWMTFGFAGMLALSKAFAQEQEDLRIRGLVLSPMDSSTLYTAKFIANCIYLTLFEVTALPFFIIFFDITPTASLGMIIVPLLLGNVGFAAVGTLFSAIAFNTRSREMMLPLLMFPVMVPVLLAAVNMTDTVLNGGTVSVQSTWFRLLIGFDVIFFTASFILYDSIIRE